MLLQDYRAFLQELFAGLGTLEIRAMFGVSGMFCDGAMFAVVADERIFLKTDETSRAGFEREGAVPFVYRTHQGGEIVTSYYELPARLFDDPDEAVVWACRAHEIALRSPASLRKRRKRTEQNTSRQTRHRRTRGLCE